MGTKILLLSEKSNSNRKETPTCYGVLSSNTEVCTTCCGSIEKETLTATHRSHGKFPEKVTFELRCGGKETFHVEKGRKGLLAHHKWHDRNNQTLDGRRVVAGVATGIRS